MASCTRVTLIIDDLGSGGAQRQLVMLAPGLKDRGHHVEVLVYQRGDFFTSELVEAGVPVTLVPFRNKLHIIYSVRKAIMESSPDVVITFLQGPSILAELARLPRRKFSLITSERVLDTTGRSMRRSVRYRLHRLADAVVSNSHSQRQHMIEAFPRLEDRTHVIVNGVDLERFAPAKPLLTSRSAELRMLVLARFAQQKNPFGLLDAVEIIRREHPQLDVVVDWYGDYKTPGNPPITRQRDFPIGLEETIAQYSLQDKFRLHRAVKNVEQLYHAADVVCLPSFSEGTANVICEAMACGIPLLVSRVSDNIKLVVEEQNGLLFDPLSPRDIADTIVRFAAKPYDIRQRMGLTGRKMAETTLSPDVLVDSYISLMEKVVTQKRGASPPGDISLP